MPPENGSANTLRPKGDFEESFKESAMCRYRMIFPSIAREFDQINYILQKSENVQVYLIETMTYKSLTYKETILEPDVSVTVTWPNESFILILASDDGEKADFSISY